MPMPRSTEALIGRTIRACQNAGMTIGSVEVMPNGTIKVFDLQAPSPVTSAAPPHADTTTCDHLFGTSQNA